MRSTLLLTAALILAAPSVAAQDGCDEADPCRWIVQVDEEGLSAPGGALEGTVGDWFVFEFHNLDPDADHTITWSLDGTSWVVAPLDTLETDAFELTEEGTFQLEDDAGDTLDVHISLDDVSGTTTTGGQDSPGLGVLAALAAVGAVFASRRR